MTTPVELTAQRRQTSAFIAVNPITITLTPSTKTKTSTGGWTYVDGVPRDEPITVRLIPVSPDQPTTTQDGRDKRADYIMLAPHDAVVVEGDWWDDELGNKYRVQFLLHNNNYEVRAGVTVHASA